MRPCGCQVSDGRDAECRATAATPAEAEHRAAVRILREHALYVESWVRPDGQRPIWSLPGLRRRAGFGVDGTYAEHSAERRGQAPQPRSGAPKAPGLRAALLGRSRLARATHPL